MMEQNKKKLNPEAIDSSLRTFKNLKQVIAKLDDFLNAEKKLEDLKILAEDPKNYLLVDQKLDSLLEMQEPLLNMSGQSKFSRKFAETREFEKAFEEKVFGVFADYLKYSKEDPAVLKNAVQIIGKRAMRDKGVYEPGMSGIWRAETKLNISHRRDLGGEDAESLKKSITINKQVEGGEKNLDDIKNKFKGKFWDIHL